MTFDRFEFDPERRALLAGGELVRLSPKAFRLLEVLLENRPRALSKQELQDAIWPGTFVEESNLPGLIAELRTALGDRERGTPLLRTVHGFGYAFAGEAAAVERSPAAAFVVFAGKTIPLYAGPNVLGRDPSSGILIDDGTVSRRHASLTIEEDRAILEDLGSKNGTFVEGKRITEPTPIADGGTFVLGDASLVLRRSSAGSTITLTR